MNTETKPKPTELDITRAYRCAGKAIVLHEYAGCTNIRIIEGNHLSTSKDRDTPQRGPVSSIAGEVALDLLRDGLGEEQQEEDTDTAYRTAEAILRRRWDEVVQIAVAAISKDIVPVGPCTPESLERAKKEIAERRGRGSKTRRRVNRAKSGKPKPRTKSIYYCEECSAFNLAGHVVVARAVGRAKIDADMDEEVVNYGPSRIQDGGDREHSMVEATVEDMQILMAGAEAEFKHIVNVCGEHHSEDVSHRATARAAGESREMLELCDKLEKATGIERSGYYGEAHGMTEYLLEENWEAVEKIAAALMERRKLNVLDVAKLLGPSPAEEAEAEAVSEAAE
jgi:hypothetical protein